MTQWAKMVDSDGDGNFEIYQLHEEDPSGLWHPDALEFWREVPDEHAAIGNVFEESSQTWYTGVAWGAKKTAEAPSPDATPQPIPIPLGAVLELEITNAGSNYETPPVRNQYDIGNGKRLVATVTYDPLTESAVSVAIDDAGEGYEVGQTFKIDVGYGRDWDRKNPDYTTVRIKRVNTNASATKPADTPTPSNSPGAPAP
jgi:hypothetical protein